MRRTVFAVLTAMVAVKRTHWVQGTKAVVSMRTDVSDVATCPVQELANSRAVG